MAWTLKPVKHIPDPSGDPKLDRFEPLDPVALDVLDHDVDGALRAAKAALAETGLHVRALNVRADAERTLHAVVAVAALPVRPPRGIGPRRVVR